MMRNPRIMPSTFSTYDFATFLCIISIPPLIGIYFGWKSRKNESMNRYFYGDKKMHPIAVGVSTAVTSISAFTLISYPAEAYLVGTTLMWVPIAIAGASITTLLLYVPFYHKLQLPTVYSYLELRFNSSTRRLVAAIATFNEIFYLGAVMFLPSLAISAVTPISTTWSILLVGGICTFYTALGGLHAVIWTDVVQFIFMVTGTLMIMIKGVQTVGGVANVTIAIHSGERDTFTRFDNFDVSSRLHPIAITLGQFFTYTKLFAFSQPMYQRMLSCKTARDSQYSMLSYLLPSALLICVSTINGLIMYAYFIDCDPVKSGLLERYDQVIPYMVQLEIGDIPGMAGIFVAAVFSGTLSTVSSFLNSCSMVFVEDFIAAAWPKLLQRKKVFIGKMCAVLLGLLVIALAYLISAMHEDIFKVLNSFNGAFGGAVVGIYLLGIFTPWTTSLGAIGGGVIATGTMLWIYLGSIFWLQATPARVTLPPVSVDGCEISNTTSLANYTTESSHQSLYPTTTNASYLIDDNRYSADQMIYSLNFHYYVPTGCILTILFGLVISFLSGAQKAKHTDPRLFMPLVSSHCFPQRLRMFFRCGVPQYIDENCCPAETTPLEMKSYS